jgi:hypothetical protein
MMTVLDFPRFSRLAVAVGAALTLSAAAGGDDDTEAVATTAAATSAVAPINVSIRYSGSVSIFKVADITVAGEFHEETYSAAARFTTAGLAALFSDADIEAGVSGYREGPGLQPYRYSHLNHASSKNRIVGINFPEGVAEADINPPFGSMGEPPATEEERDGAIDPLSALLSVSLGSVATADSLCQGRLPIFDGKARYNLRFEEGPVRNVRTRAWRGDAQVCYAYYEPISGYDADEYPSDSDIADPITLWMAPVDEAEEVYVPVKIRANTGFGGIMVNARSIETE